LQFLAPDTTGVARTWENLGGGKCSSRAGEVIAANFYGRQNCYFGNAQFRAKLLMRRVSDTPFSISYDSIYRFRNEEISWQRAYKKFIRSFQNLLETVASFF